MDAEQHGGEVLDDAHRYLAAIEQRLGHGARHLEVGGEVAPEAELDVPGREQQKVHRAQLAVRLACSGLLGERRLVGVRRDDALEGADSRAGSRPLTQTGAWSW
ncbi:MAG: hypothetical protein IPJ56_09115 [Gemmatimonadetes bacterium]|nr:hypothetical protein [Gemmatimonadota bacterium]